MILRRIEGERFSEVLPLWAGLTAVVIGGGPSLTMEQVALVGEMRAAGEVRAVAVNDAYLLAPWADVVYAADSHWFAWQEKGVEKPGFTAEDVRASWAAFAGQKCTIQNSGANVTDAAVHMLRNRSFPDHANGLSLEPRALVTGRNSGFQALNLAVLAGAKRVILLGIDGKAGDGGRSHWFGEHPRPTPEAIYQLIRESMTGAAGELQRAGVEVVNASPDSAVDAFPMVLLEQALA